MTRRSCLFGLLLIVNACGGDPPTGPGSGLLTLDTGAEVRGIVGVDAVTLTTTSNGIRYNLAVPATALLAPTEITMTPIRAAGGAIGDAGLAGGVQLLPEGLTFARAATLTIEAASIANAERLFGISADGDGSAPHLVPLGLDGGEATLAISHFSTAAIVTSAEAIPAPPAGAIREAAEQVIMESVGNIEQPPSAASMSTITDAFRTWYNASVRIKLQAAGGGATDIAAVVALSEHDAWLTSLGFVSLLLGDPSGTQLLAALGDLVTEGRELTAAALRAGISRGNTACLAQPANLANARQAAANVLFWQSVADAHALAGPGSDQFADLTLDEVLASLCLQIAYTDVQLAETFAIGDQVPFAVRVGFRVGEGGPIFGTSPDVAVQPAGATAATGQTLGGATDADGFFATELAIQQNAVVINVHTCGPLTGRLDRICHDTLVVRNVGGVSVAPATATLAPGATQQFTATVDNSTDQTVTWSATGGAISSSGLYTAGQTPGTYGVTATSVANTAASGSAQVTIGIGFVRGATYVGKRYFQGTPSTENPVALVFNSTDTQMLQCVIPSAGNQPDAYRNICASAGAPFTNQSGYALYQVTVNGASVSGQLVGQTGTFNGTIDGSKLTGRADFGAGLFNTYDTTRQ